MKNLILVLFFAITSNLIYAQNARVFTTSDGAIRGYDPVAYFTASKAVKGKPELSYTWQNAHWHFATEENRKAFAANPEKFAPQYGGYCAYGWAKGYAVKTEPDAWSVVNGKLYLNYDMSVRQKWEKDPAGYIRKADENWNK